jgi:hypothetical protein
MKSAGTVLDNIDLNVDILNFVLYSIFTLRKGHLNFFLCSTVDLMNRNYDECDAYLNAKVKVKDERYYNATFHKIIISHIWFDVRITVKYTLFCYGLLKYRLHLQVQK